MPRRNRIFENQANVSRELFRRLGGSERTQHNATCLVIAPLKADAAALLRDLPDDGRGLGFYANPDGLRTWVCNLADTLGGTDLVAEPGIYLTREHWDDPVLRVTPDGITLAGHIRKDPAYYLGRSTFEPGSDRGDESQED
jgi:hypothetical protein